MGKNDPRMGRIGPIGLGIREGREGARRGKRKTTGWTGWRVRIPILSIPFLIRPIRGCSFPRPLRVFSRPSRIHPRVLCVLRGSFLAAERGEAGVEGGARRGGAGGPAEVGESGRRMERD